MAISAALLEIKTHIGPGYLPLVDYGAWRVALMRWCVECLPANIAAMARHAETDEVFALLEGRCILFIGAGPADCIGEIEAQDMAPGCLYNVKRGVWHAHAFSPDALVLIVENRDTTSHNSFELALTDGQRQKILDLTDALWHR